MSEANSNTGPIIRVNNLRIHASASGRTLVDGVSFDANPGETVGLVGESGSGKSLTLRAIMGLLPEGVDLDDAKAIAIAPVDAAARTEGVPLRDDSHNPRLAMIFQDPVFSLDPLTGVVKQVAEVLRYNQRIPSRESKTRAADLLISLGLPESLRSSDRYPGQLSGGQCQRVGIAIALATKPDILLCDEPTTALDVTVQLQILDLLADLRQRLGLTMLFVTHNLGVAARLCDRLMVMQHGRIVETGATQDILNNPQQEYTRRLVNAILPIPGEQDQ
ncbi:ABC transporter ATP-binding protein [Bifidobacterium felsineum]|uniref:Peptide ABC transporter ATP-binding protein n=1 Tax=Bifidobacterium felsineum TaxID=2045440 RepID=A0A2M9HIJ0_9BIFI|nr:ABC transporter ATP-binding protein [Bifidobacterium felsineum]MBT1164894.1 ABC transporter ATP-binding protein [Bifidobacterium felsineum]PJM76632.1 peptide ABC transporter ATP-binding protein [Bifidobacterium felsineum]